LLKIEIPLFAASANLSPRALTAALEFSRRVSTVRCFIFDAQAGFFDSHSPVQRKNYLFVCINRRAEDNPKGCCAAKDSEEVYRALKTELAARGLAKLEARVCTSSCLDQCATGVTVLVEPDHFFYGRVTIADVPEIVDGLVTGRPVKRLLITADQHDEKN
jgi:(2Fe-2S) ferredoxin